MLIGRRLMPPCLLGSGRSVSLRKLLSVVDSSGLVYAYAAHDHGLALEVMTGVEQFQPMSAVCSFTYSASILCYLCVRSMSGVFHTEAIACRLVLAVSKYSSLLVSHIATFS